MTLLYQRSDVSAARARELLELTAGNLETHARKLEAAGWLKSRKVLTPGGFVQRLRITGAGVAAFETYLQRLEEFVADFKGSRKPAPTGPAPA